jgi:radical SAM protein with 4Fe4S-binding SPASM domain
MNVYIEKGRWLKTFKHIKQSYQYFKEEKELSFHLIATKRVSMLSILIWFWGKKIRNIELILNYKSLRPRLLQWVQRKNVRFTVLLVVDRKLKPQEWKRICKLDGVIRIWDNTNENEALYANERRVVCETQKKGGFLEADEFRLVCGQNVIYQCNHTSCLGKYIYVAKDGTLSFCPKYVNETIVGTIDNPESFFQSDVFASALQKMIVKRDACKKSCDYFEKCKGGCLFEEACDKFRERQIAFEKEIEDIVSQQRGLETLHFAKEMSLLQSLEIVVE